MKKLCVITLSLWLTACGTMQGSYVDDATGGAFIGGIAGALFGAAAGGRDAAAVGGVLGAVVGSAVAVDQEEAAHRQRRAFPYAHEPQALPPQAPPVVYYPAPYPVHPPYPYAYPYPPPVIYKEPSMSFRFGFSGGHHRRLAPSYAHPRPRRW